MHPDPESEAALRRLIVVRMGKRLLNPNGAFDGINRTGELGQNTISSRIGNPPTVLGDQLVHDLTVSGERAERPNLVLLHEARIACHVSREDGCQPPLDLLL
jgi:hypothetical protein